MQLQANIDVRVKELWELTNLAGGPFLAFQSYPEHFTNLEFYQSFSLHFDTPENFS
jgi:hypothetical protein